MWQALLFSLLFTTRQRPAALFKLNSEFLTFMCSISSIIIMLSDFNIHIDYVSNTSTSEFQLKGCHLERLHAESGLWHAGLSDIHSQFPCLKTHLFTQALGVMKCIIIIIRYVPYVKEKVPTGFAKACC